MSSKHVVTTCYAYRWNVASTLHSLICWKFRVFELPRPRQTTLLPTPRQCVGAATMKIDCDLIFLARLLLSWYVYLLYFIVNYWVNLYVIFLLIYWFIYLFVYWFIYQFIYLFIYLLACFIYLFACFIYLLIIYFLIFFNHVYLFKNLFIIYLFIKH